MTTDSISILNDREGRITELASRYKGLTIAGVDDKEGFTAVVKARKELKRERVEIETDAYALRESAIKFQKAVISREKELVGIILPVEKELQKEEEFIEAQREAIRKEAERKEAERLQNRINQLAAFGHAIDLYEATYMEEDKYQELLKEAQNAHTLELERRRKEEEEKHEQARIESERMAKQRAELEKQKAEQKARELELKRQEQERIEQEKKRQETIRIEEEKRQAAIRAEREKLEAERRKFEQEKREEQERKEAEQRAKEEAERKAKIEAEAKIKAEQEAKLKAEREELLKPDKEILKAFALNLSNVKIPPVKSKEANELRQQIILDFTHFIGSIERKTESL